MTSTMERKRGRPSGKSGKNKAPRSPVMLPTAWNLLAKKIAAEERRPAVWYIVSLIEADAKARGIKDLPPGPWEIPADPGESGPSPQE